jgi:hypothetical protein
MEKTPETSPRFGFELTPEMGRALAPALDYYDSWEDDPIEVLEIAVREELGLAHTLNYNIDTDLPQPQGVVRQFARANGKWEAGFVNPEAWQFKQCEEEMRKSHNLRESAWGHEAMIDGSRIYEPKPWAINYILEIWDRRSSFHSFLGWLSEQEPEERFSIHDLEPDEGAKLYEVMKELTNRRIRSDELQLMMTALDLVAGKSATASEILEFFVES